MPIFSKLIHVAFPSLQIKAFSNKITINSDATNIYPSREKSFQIICCNDILGPKPRTQFLAKHSTLFIFSETGPFVQSLETQIQANTFLMYFF